MDVLITPAARLEIEALKALRPEPSTWALLLGHKRGFRFTVGTDLPGRDRSPSVYYYTRDFTDVQGAPLIHCYDAAFSEELQRYHVLLDDLSKTHITAEEKTPTLEYGLALAEGLAVMHAHWWGAQRFTEVGATMHSAEHIQRFVDISESGVENIINHFSFNLNDHTGQISLVHCTPGTHRQ